MYINNRSHNFLYDKPVASLGIITWLCSFSQHGGLELLFFSIFQVSHLVSYVTTLLFLLSEPYAAFRCSSDGPATPSLEVVPLMLVCRRQRGLQKEVILHFVAPNSYNLKITVLKITCQPKLDLHYMTLIKVSCHQVFTLVRRVSASCEINWATFRVVVPT